MTAEARARAPADIVARLREWSAADMDTHAILRRNGLGVAILAWSRHGTDLAETVLGAAAEIERLRRLLDGSGVNHDQRQ